ncbi:hypothetical protein HGI30_21495 [Paenibacillus albicereus]|uniref:DoxX family membrane protein n=1 Tax=Paenibacillus albicereus TaxID=2726185 RepID=A0A6H2H2I0_9BACL|nr:hypothetical protein [Paenibacillus albicereus]QJC53845.1 hypothetical protein HGI30_21495 [Paenibacillus albicereus]
MLPTMAFDLLPPFLHVKWFACGQGSHPLLPRAVLTPAFLAWSAFTAAVLTALAALSSRLERARPRLTPGERSAGGPSASQLAVLRAGLAAGLLLQLLYGVYLVPVFVPGSPWVHGLTAAALGGLLHRRLFPASAAALAALYATAVAQYGLFHTLDYAFYLGLIYVLIAVSPLGKRLVLPPLLPLYLTTGFSLCWLAMEKLTMPELSESLLAAYRLPTFGFAPGDFVLLSALIEFALGWALLTGLLNRAAALLLSAIFATTASVFGATEVIGHLIVHAILIVFLMRDTRSFKPAWTPPSSAWASSLAARCALTTASFFALLGLLLVLYAWAGRDGYSDAPSGASRPDAGAPAISVSLAHTPLTAALLVQYPGSTTA